MCIFNQDCKISDRSCGCLLDYHRAEELNELVRILRRQIEILKTIASQNEFTIDYLSQFSESRFPSQLSPQTTEKVDVAENLLGFLTGKTSDFSYEIRLLEALPEPFHKNRTFTVKCAVFDTAGCQVTLRACFRILLFTEDFPPKELHTTKSGDKMIKGNFEIETDKEIVFNKLMFKEASSHHLNRKLVFVVTSSLPQIIKPLIATNILIKTRKDCSALPAKKRKVD